MKNPPRRLDGGSYNYAVGSNNQHFLALEESGIGVNTRNTSGKHYQSCERDKLKQRTYRNTYAKVCMASLMMH